MGSRVDSLAQLEERALAYAPRGPERTTDPAELLADFIVGHDLEVDGDGDWMIVHVGVLADG